MKRFLLPACLSLACAQAEAPLGYDNLPLGDKDAPLILRTYLPDPGIDDAVFAHHGRGRPSPRYSPAKGRDVEGTYEPIDGIPAAIAVSHGPALAYAFDTTECRVLYAWQGGFLDMYPYWGTPEGGGRRSFDYVPRLVGTVFMMAEGAHPLRVDGEPLADLGRPRFIGYDLDDHGVPTFRFAAGDHEITQRIEPMEESPLSCVMTFRSEAELDYHSAEHTEVTRKNDALVVAIRGRELSTHDGFQRDTEIDEPTAEVGEKLFSDYGCIACHSVDGSQGHGPSLQGLAGSERPIEGADDPVPADADYLRESILEPNARTAAGFPPNYMPPYALTDAEVESLVLYIQSLDAE